MTDSVLTRSNGWLYKLGDCVQKKRGSSWRGTVCGFYSTTLTPYGIAVESAYEPGSVQIYPQEALDFWDPEMYQLFTTITICE